MPVIKAGYGWEQKKGLNVLDPNTDQITLVSSDPRNKYSLVGKAVKSIFVDKNDIYWVGTYQGGVNKYDENLAFFNLRQSNYLDPLGLSNPTVTSFVEAPSGDLYIGTDGGGLNLFRRKTGVFEHPNLSAKNKGKNSSILTMERIGNELWMGSYGEGILVLDMITGASRQYLKGDSRKSLSSNEIFCIKKDGEGKIWIGTNGNGVNIYDPTTGAFFKVGFSAHTNR